MFLDVYIGRLDDPLFRWDGGDWNGNVPRRISSFFPPNGGQAFWEVLKRIKAGSWTGKQTDWGGWVAKLKGDEIRSFVEEIYADNPTYMPGSALPWLQPKLEELRTFIKELNLAEVYALVAVET